MENSIAIHLQVDNGQENNYILRRYDAVVYQKYH